MLRTEDFTTLQLYRRYRNDNSYPFYLYNIQLKFMKKNASLAKIERVEYRFGIYIFKKKIEAVSP